MKRPFPYSPRTGVVLALVALVLRWQILQAVAWITMLVSYSLEHGLSRAWQMTFSGEHPCPICHLVKLGTSLEPAVMSWMLVVPIALALLVPSTIATRKLSKA